MKTKLLLNLAALCLFGGTIATADKNTNAKPNIILILAEASKAPTDKITNVKIPIT